MTAALVLSLTLGLSTASPQPTTTSTPEPPEPAASEVEPAHPARARWLIDGLVTGTSAATFGILEYWVTPQLDVPTAPAPGRPDSVGRVDAVAIGHFRPGAALASDVLMGASVAAPIIIHGVEAGVRGDRIGLRYGTDLLLFAEALSINLLVTETLKFAVRRPRPLVYTDPAALGADAAEDLREAQGEPDAYKSFPSGHASLSFAAAVAGSTLLTLKWRKGTRRQKIGLGLVWGFSVAVAGTTAALRVVAGKHYPSDVVAGSILGSGIGALVPLAHARDLERRRPIALSPVLTPQHRGASLVARF